MLFGFSVCVQCFSRTLMARTFSKQPSVAAAAAEAEAKAAKAAAVKLKEDETTLETMETQ